jgi:hypothetical protein
MFKFLTEVCAAHCLVLFQLVRELLKGGIVIILPAVPFMAIELMMYLRQHI